MCGLPAQVGPSIVDWLLSPISKRSVQLLDLLTRCRPWICSKTTRRSSSPNWLRRAHTHPLQHQTLAVLSIPAHNVGTCLLLILAWWQSLCCSAQLSVCMLPSTVWHMHCTTCWDAIQLPVCRDLKPKSIPGRWFFFFFIRGDCRGLELKYFL